MQWVKCCSAEYLILLHSDWVLIIDAMIIRSHSRWSGGIEDLWQLALENVVIMLLAVAFRSSWKLLVTFIMSALLTFGHYIELLIRCIKDINDTGANVWTIVIDWAPTNLTTFRRMLQTSSISFQHCESQSHSIRIFLDNFNRSNLVRNSFSDIRVHPPW